MGVGNEPSPGNGAVPGEMAERMLAPRLGARLTTKERAARLGMSVWKVELLERTQEEEKAAQRSRSPPEPTARLQPPVAEEGPQQAVSAAGEVAEAAAAADAEAASNAGRGSMLILGAIVALVIIRFFSEVVRILPGFTNFVDIPIFATIMFAAALRPAAENEFRKLPPMLGIVAFLFIIVCSISTLANLSRVELAPALVFLYGFLGPVAIYFAVYKLWPAGSAMRLSRVLVGLGILQIAVAFLIDLPRWLSDPGRNPDLFSGTFGENPYQLVFFLLIIIGLLAGIFTFEKRRAIAPFTPFLLVAIFGVIFLAQYRALLLTTALTIILLAVLLAPLSARGVVGATLALVALVGTLAYAAQNIPEFKFKATIEDTGGDPTFYLKQRLKTIDPVERMFGDTPRYTIIGTGPGSYSSRAWRTFAVTPDSATDVTNKYAQKLTGGRPYHTDVSDKYLLPELRTAALISGSHAITSPFSSYLSLLAEVGVPGFALIVGIYLWALLASLRMARVSLRAARPGDPLPALLCASLVAFFALLQMGVLENWLEVTRITFITWIVFAVATKEYNARRLDEDGPTPAPVAV